MSALICCEDAAYWFVISMTFCVAFVEQSDESLFFSRWRSVHFFALKILNIRSC